MKLTTAVTAAIACLAIASVACGARVTPEPALDGTGCDTAAADSGPSVDGGASAADAADSQTVWCGETTCGAEGCCGSVCCGFDSSTGAGGVCTADMLASIKPFCGGAASGTYFTGLLDFACAGTTADAPDRDMKLGAFCTSHKVGDTVHAEIADGGTGFLCYCFVA